MTTKEFEAKLIALTDKWSKDFLEAHMHISKLKNGFSTSPGHYDYEFYALCEWLLSTEVSFYDIMENPPFGSLERTHMFFLSLYHAMVDDGDSVFARVIKDGKLIRASLHVDAHDSDYSYTGLGKRLLEKETRYYHRVRHLRPEPIYRVEFHRNCFLFMEEAVSIHWQKKETRLSVDRQMAKLRAKQ